jgi:hypothetical protein
MRAASPSTRRRALERDGRWPAQLVERGPEEHQDLGDGLERERLEANGDGARAGLAE